MKNKTENKILIVCPTRNNGDLINKFYDAFQENSSICDLVFSLDYDDEMNYPRFEADNVFYEVGYRNNIVPAMNHVAYKYAQNSQYEFIGMLNDDHIIKTKDWDSIIYEKIKNDKTAIAYPNDLNEKTFSDKNTLIQGARNLFASAVIMNTNIIKSLGYIGNPLFTHAYLDRLWIDLGKRLSSLYYFHDIIVDHKPFHNSEFYAEHYRNGQKDEDMYYFYIENCLDNDVKKIKKYLELYHQ